MGVFCYWINTVFYVKTRIISRRCEKYDHTYKPIIFYKSHI